MRIVNTLLSAIMLSGSVVASVHAAPTSTDAVVSSDPANYTPRVMANAAGLKVAVYKTAKVGTTMYSGGEFTEVQSADRSTTYPRANLFAFSPTTGEVKPLSVSMDGAVYAIASAGRSLYVGGTFTSVNGVARRGIVKMNRTTGVVDEAFNAQLDGPVHEARVVDGRLIIGGGFTKRLLAVDLATGADTGYFDLEIVGDVDGEGAWSPRVWRFTVDPSRTHLVAVGNFLTVNGVSRARAFMVDLGSTAGTLNAWYYQPLERPCRAASILDYLRDVDFSPDGSYFVIVASGYLPPTTQDVGTSVCDGAARFETANPAPTAPTWINYTGGDTLQSTWVSSDAVYVQGHNRWLDNPYGQDTCGAGCVSRPGIGAIDPTTGLALAWNPTKDRAEGGKDLLRTRDGLWVSSDTTVIGGETHERLALMPSQHS